MRPVFVFASAIVIPAALVLAQSGEPDWSKANADTLTHYSAVVRIDTSAKERAAADYIKKVLDDHGIPAFVRFQYEIVTALARAR